MTAPDDVSEEIILALLRVRAMRRIDHATTTTVVCSRRHVLARIIRLAGLAGAPRLLVTELREESRRADGALGLTHTNRRTAGVYELDALMADAERNGSVRSWCRCSTWLVPLPWLAEQIASGRQRVRLEADATSPASRRGGGIVRE